MTSTYFDKNGRAWTLTLTNRDWKFVVLQDGRRVTPAEIMENPVLGSWVDAVYWSETRWSWAKSWTRWTGGHDGDGNGEHICARIGGGAYGDMTLWKSEPSKMLRMW